MSTTDSELFLSKGNMYKTLVRIDDDAVVFRQRQLIPAVAVAFFALMGFALSPWLGIPLLLCALLLLVWFKQVSIFPTLDKVVGVSGIPPLCKTFQGTTRDVNFVTFREVISSRTTEGNQSFGRWVIWDIDIYAFNERFVFSVWEEGDREKVEKIALALSEMIGCELRRILPNKPDARDGL